MAKTADNSIGLDRRAAIKGAGAAVLALMANGVMLPEAASAAGIPWSNGMYQTFPELWAGNTQIEQFIDLGRLGLDVDRMFGFDFLGNIPTGAEVIYEPKNGIATETRVVGLIRTDLETVQFRAVTRGDRFDMYRVSDYGNDAFLDQIARLHAQNTAHTHQKVVFIGDLGRFEREWGTGETELLNRIIWAQRPGMPEIGIQESNFVNARRS